MSARIRVAQLRELGRYDDAERAARQGLAADPQDPDLLTELAAVLLGAVREADGLVAADAAVAVAPQSERAHRIRGVLLSRLGRHDEALQAGFTAVGLAPHEPYAALGYATVLQQAGRLPDALQVARRAVELAPDEAEMHLRLADIAAQLGDRALARRAYTETLRLDPQHAMARNDLAVLDLETRRPRRALRGLVEAGRMDPTNPLVLTNVAAVLWRLSWRLRMLCVVATLAVVGASGAGSGDDLKEPTGGARIAGGIVLVAIALVTWLTVRGLPRGTAQVARAALRTDRPLSFTYRTLALCVLIYAAVAVTGIGLLAAVVWLALGVLGVLAGVVGLLRRRRARR